MKPGIFREPVEAYLAKLALRGALPHPVFEAMHAEASRRNFPIIGPEVGRFFFQLASLRKPARILELGSGFGYSAIWWALGAPKAEIHCTEHKQANIDAAMTYATEADVASRLHFHKGDALATARTLKGRWDIIFCDLDKEEYPAALGFAQGIQRPGDILLFDNMLWHGHVAEDEGDWDAATEAVVATARRLYDNAGWATSLLPIRDGVLMAVRK